MPNTNLLGRVFCGPSFQPACSRYHCRTCSPVRTATPSWDAGQTGVGADRHARDAPAALTVGKGAAGIISRCGRAFGGKGRAMRAMTAIMLAVALGLAGPAYADHDGSGGGLAQYCQSINDEAMDRMIAQYRSLSEDDLFEIVSVFARKNNKTIPEMSEAEKAEVVGLWREGAMTVPVVMNTFCDYFRRGALPGVGDGKGHGTFLLGFDIFSFPAEEGTESEAADPAGPEPGADDCEKPYPITLKLEGRPSTRHVFCEAGGAFTLTSSHRADSQGNWTKIK